MARTKTDRNATTAAASRSWQRARQTAQDAKPVAAQVKPLANDTKAAASRGLRKARAWAAPQVERTGQVIQDSVAPAARRGVRKARAWAAPQVDRTGQVIQDTVAPKVAAALHSSAQRLDPDKPKRHTLAQGGRHLGPARGGRRDRGRAAQPHRAQSPRRRPTRTSPLPSATRPPPTARRTAGPHLLTHATGDPAAGPDMRYAPRGRPLAMPTRFRG